MELVPILSTIILVGTIATFILAVAAYILYKIRERRARDESRPAAYAQPEPHVLVAPQVAGAIQMQQPSEASVYGSTQAPVAIHQHQHQSSPQSSPQSSLFWEYTDEGFVPVNPQEEPVQAPQRETQRPASQQQQQQDEGYAWL